VLGHLSLYNLRWGRNRLNFFAGRHRLGARQGAHLMRRDATFNSLFVGRRCGTRVVRIGVNGRLIT
jgi:hypothetical protein